MGIKIHGMRLGGFPVPLDMLFDAGGGAHHATASTTATSSTGSISAPSLSYIIEHPDAGPDRVRDGRLRPTGTKSGCPTGPTSSISPGSPQKSASKAQLQDPRLGTGRLRARHPGASARRPRRRPARVRRGRRERSSCTKMSGATASATSPTPTSSSSAPTGTSSPVRRRCWSTEIRRIFRRRLDDSRCPATPPARWASLVRLDSTGWVFLTSDAMYFHDTIGEPNATLGRQHAARGLETTRSTKIARIAAESRRLPPPRSTDLVGSQYTEGVAEAKRIDFAPGAVYE